MPKKFKQSASPKFLATIATPTVCGRRLSRQGWNRVWRQASASAPVPPRHRSRAALLRQGRDTPVGQVFDLCGSVAVLDPECGPYLRIELDTGLPVGLLAGRQEAKLLLKAVQDWIRMLDVAGGPLATPH
jgi:hypothetical protein